MGEKRDKQVWWFTAVNIMEKLYTQCYLSACAQGVILLSKLERGRRVGAVLSVSSKKKKIVEAS